MAWVSGGKHFGQYTLEHWFDDEFSGKPEKGEKIMRKEIVTLFVQYNKSVNEAMNGVITTLSPDEWEKNLGGYFSSVRGMCSHLYICDFNWLKRFKNLRSFTTLNDPFFNQSYGFHDLIFRDKNEYLAKRPDLDERMLTFTAEITEDDLAGVFRYADSAGTTHERNFGGCLLQFLNHETHHRGMISLYLEMLGRENEFSSLAQVLT
jgi:uncharacterized damage-inducible protein DinB